MQVVDWSIVSFFVVINEQAKQMAHAIAAKIAGFSWLKSGRATISTPLNPMPTDNKRRRVNASPRNTGASKATHNGVENSNANSC